jgi:hypothetical protein
LGGFVAGGAAEVCLAPLVAILSGGSEVVVPAPPAALDEKQNSLGIALPNVVGAWRAIETFGLWVIEDNFIVGEGAAGGGNQERKKD